MTRAWIRTLLARDLRAFATELDRFADEARIWATLPGVNNPAGTLALHVSGNLQHFVGARLGSTGYVRDRPREFATRGLSRAELKAELQRALDVVETILPKFDEARLEEDYPEPIEGAPIATGLFLLRLVAHLSLHLGQAGYLRRMLEEETPSAP
jgi:hypothetical protein